MQIELPDKLNAMLWDLPVNKRSGLSDKILTDPVQVFHSDEQLFIRVLNSLKWYELMKLVGRQNMLDLLTDSTIKKLYPVQRRTFYTNARRLLSKYTVPAAGQST
ncbi:MAG: hypothetical protein U1C46_10620 [Bacteroidales bacterium]|nr:hypothetical protein [Bacteroidales bacterium]MDZ4205253.1 hypothetical protein [Bacteroidales bacterium]